MNPEILDHLARQDADNGVERLVVGAVIEHGGKVLLLRRPDDEFMGGIYELPSGKVEPGETLTDALAREVAEETGLTIQEITGHLGSFDYKSSCGRHTRQHNFAVSVQPPLNITLTEHDHSVWTSGHEQYTVSNAVADLLRTYLAEPRTPMAPHE